jgi:hypothetical protein
MGLGDSVFAGAKKEISLGKKTPSSRQDRFVPVNHFVLAVVVFLVVFEGFFALQCYYLATVTHTLRRGE